MKCKFCGAEMAQWGTFCPSCGKKNDEEAAVLNEAEIFFPEEEQNQLPEEEQEVFEAEEMQEEQSDAPSPSLKKAKRMAAMSGCVALLAVLATVLFFGIRGGWEVEKWFDWLKPRENTIAYKDNYTADDKKVFKKRDEVVATMGDLQLTNAQLQIYYWKEVYDFLDQYAYYLSYIGMDYTKPLDQQTCYFDNTVTWQQYFLRSAIEVWQSNTAFAERAKADGFVLPEEYRTELDSMVATLTKKATEGGYASVDAMVQESFGPGCTVQDYVQYMETFYTGYLYFSELYEAETPTLEEVKAYYAANEDKLVADGIKKDGNYTVDVRHILVMIDNIVAEMEKDNNKTDAQAESGDKDDTESKYTEEQWAACQEAAQKIYDEWLAGDKTEEHFGELANKYSHDQKGEVTNGGICTFVKKGEMVEEFDAWCFAEKRQPGDTGIVKTQFGYHVMYFVGSEENWITQTRSAYMSEKSNQIVEDTLSKYTVEIDYKKIVLGDVDL